jgi:hypothetical protein
MNWIRKTYLRLEVAIVKLPIQGRLSIANSDFHPPTTEDISDKHAVLM